jgi:thymidylate kinase
VGVIAQVLPSARRGLLIAAEGLDGSGTAAAVDAIGHWFERRGQRIHIVPWERSRLVPRAAASSRGRHVLTPRVAALLTAVDAARSMAREVERPLARGDVVLCDRYAWTAVAREIARGLEPDWISAVYRFMPRPDLLILHRQEASGALARALATRPAAVAAEALAAEFGEFLQRMASTFDALAAAAGDAMPDRGRLGPWPVEVVVRDPRGSDASTDRAVRDALRRLIAGAPAAVS